MLRCAAAGEPHSWLLLSDTAAAHRSGACAACRWFSWQSRWLAAPCCWRQQGYQVPAPSPTPAPLLPPPPPMSHTTRPSPAPPCSCPLPCCAVPQGTKVNAKGKEVPHAMRLYTIASTRYGDAFDGKTVRSRGPLDALAGLGGTLHLKTSSSKGAWLAVAAPFPTLQNQPV